MELLMALGLFVVSLTALLWASDRFVGSAEKIGLSLGISPFIIGVTIVAFGTSLPELATSIISVREGTSEIVIGNVIGSNITNILLVLGATAFVGRGIKLDFNVMEVDMPLLVGSALLLWLSIRDGFFSYVEVSLFIVALIMFMLNSLKGDKASKDSRPSAKVRDYVILLFSSIMVYFSADFTIDAIVKIATMASIDPHIIALTVVALGTSLPELIVSIAATRKGKHAMAVGNVLGSNIFNTYVVMGVSALFGRLTIPSEVIGFDIIMMLLATFLFMLVCIGGKINRWEGAMLTLFYVYFIAENVKGIM